MSNRQVVGICETVLMMLILSACITVSQTPSAPQNVLVAPPTNSACAACDQATLIAAQTQEKVNADNQAAATAEVLRVNAQVILNSADATLGAIQTQDQNNADALAAQIAATAEIVRANAQATVNSASSTQYAAQTQDAIGQTQVADLATTGAQAIAVQQNKDELGASTQTAIANNIATQTQAAAATSQWYVDQDRQRAEQRKGPISFLWALCLPIFMLIFAGLILWGIWRWLRIQQANQRILENPVGELPATTAEVRRHRHDDPLPYVETEVDSGYQVTTPDDQVQKWVDEVKSKLRDSDEKDVDDTPDNGPA